MKPTAATMVRILIAVVVINATLSMKAIAVTDMAIQTSVIANVVPACLLIVKSSLNFGVLATTASATISVPQTNTAGLLTATCSSQTSYALTVDTGLNASGAQRRLRLGATSNYMQYNLYADSAYSIVFPTSQSSTSTGPADTNVYAQIPVQTVNLGGTYTDMLTFTVTY